MYFKRNTQSDGNYVPNYSAKKNRDTSVNILLQILKLKNKRGGGLLTLSKKNCCKSKYPKTNVMPIKITVIRKPLNSNSTESINSYFFGYFFVITKLNILIIA